MGVLEGKVAVVTGASRGIGAAIAERLAAEGAKVVAAARTVEASQSRLEGTIGDTVARIEAAGGTAFAQPTDLSREQDRQALVQAAEERYGTVDILVNNAAVTYFTPVSEFTDRRYDLMFEVQVNAPFHLARLVIPGMRERGAGWILNISSIAARHPTFPPGPYAGFGGTVYGMCKAALERFTTGLAAELYADGIAVNALSPNQVVPTPGTLFHRLTTDDAPDNEPPEVMADAALALCHRPAAELTGRIAYSQDLLAELQAS
ncbi:NAD(P)-dependent dehydrogenase (short-subunit alcohol dehydrogenase family) [Nonomuraea thailandensis]|uniref:NAD(P)-dependent dehydrogenase (Short-subunit alcohol dehydrogenase family) n=1 Tax=Nonomuraea thailandensis TaxID=1188745 RepID=A0A9X2H031_9ACTN|nr:SDR family NAD(P)-dependent oxidoreductase [Nonomuraea thailandensis]MCP2364113.1 NAD(P)-dependent dehydrogenase (short-subunit alcohol dehydrogenase family) [Nonomuraea thailandensis]